MMTAVMQTHADITESDCVDVSKCASVIEHTWAEQANVLTLVSRVSSRQHGYRQGNPNSAGPPVDNVRENRGRTPSIALFLSHLFFHFFRGVAALSTAPLTRSGCGVGLIHLALCVCLEQNWLLKIVVRETAETSIMCERDWEKEKLPK